MPSTNRPTEVFDADNPSDILARNFLEDRLEDQQAGRLRFPSNLTPDQHEDWLIGQAATVACLVDKALKEKQA